MLTCLALLAASGLLAGGTVGAQADIVPGDLEPMGPIRCTDDDVVVSGRLISTEGNGVEAAGNCDVQIHGSYIKAGGVAVLAEGNSDVEIHDSHVEGDDAALSAAGNADIRVRGSRIVGETVVRGNADIEDEGGNEMTGRTSSEAPSGSDRPATPPAGGGAASELSDACAGICQAWPSLDEVRTTCVTVALDSRGYEVLGNAGCIDVESTPDCVACWWALKVSAEDCAAIAEACLGR